MFRTITAAMAIGLASAAIGASQSTSSAAPDHDPAADSKVCKYVVSAKRGSKPFQMCLTKSQWAAKTEKDAMEANRIVCRYEEKIGTRLVSRKICQPASEWAEQQQMHRDQVQDIQIRVCVPGGGC